MVNRREIAEKGTTTYLPHKTIHMMPTELISLMALLPRKRRLAFSVFFKIDIKGNIYESRFEKTIVSSTAKLSYDEAQKLIDDEGVEIQVEKNLTES